VHFVSRDLSVPATTPSFLVLGEALVDAEQAALRAHEQVLTSAGGSLRVVTGPADAEVVQREAGLDAESARRAVDGGLDTAWTACGDHVRPATGKTCEASFLACFHCGNCLVTRDHLPPAAGAHGCPGRASPDDERG
jgi:hypothetical protein